MNEVTYESTIPMVEEVTMEDQDVHLTDFALGLLRALRDLESRKNEVDSQVYVAITSQLWEVLDNITLRLFTAYLKPQAIESN